MSKESIRNKHINPLIEEGDSIADTVQNATNLLDYLSIIECEELRTHVDDSARYWIARVAIDALNYSAEALDHKVETISS